MQMRRRAGAPSPNANIARQRRFWTRNASSWHHHAANNPGLLKVLDAVIAESSPSKGHAAVDLGCGSGQLALRLAPEVASVIAVDISEAMIELLRQSASDDGVTNVTAVASAMEDFDLAPSSVDLVVSSYALHHLHDSDKQVVVNKAAQWLRPGGRLVIGDMMFGRGANARDRAIIASKVRVFLTMGPGGWWRIVKNAGRYLFRTQERPVSVETWVQYLEQAGLTSVHATNVVNEAAVVSGVRSAV